MCCCIPDLISRYEASSAGAAAYAQHETQQEDTAEVPAPTPHVAASEQQEQQDGSAPADIFAANPEQPVAESEAESPTAAAAATAASAAAGNAFMMPFAAPQAVTAAASPGGASSVGGAGNGNGGRSERPLTERQKRMLAKREDSRRRFLERKAKMAERRAAADGAGQAGSPATNNPFSANLARPKPKTQKKQPSPVGVGFSNPFGAQ